jgi:hypothetical protein
MLQRVEVDALVIQFQTCTGPDVVPGHLASSSLLAILLFCTFVLLF